MSDLIQKRNQYAPAFQLLLSDFVRVMEFVEPVDQHLEVHSHRLYELLLRSCTEFESICRDRLEAEGHERTEFLNIKDFVKVEPKLELREQTAVVLFWRPQPIRLTPFGKWTPEEPSLTWYKGYNAVKHNRNSEFPHASLRNVRDSITALFILLARLGLIRNDGSHLHTPGSGWEGTYTYDGMPFALEYKFKPPKET